MTKLTEVIKVQNLSEEHWKYTADANFAGKIVGEVRRVENQVYLSQKVTEGGGFSFGYWGAKATQEPLPKGYYRIEADLVVEGELETTPSVRIRTNFNNWQSNGVGQIQLPPKSTKGRAECFFYADGTTPLLIFVDGLGNAETNWIGVGNIRIGKV